MSCDLGVIMFLLFSPFLANQSALPTCSLFHTYFGKMQETKDCLNSNCCDSNGLGLKVWFSFNRSLDLGHQTFDSKETCIRQTSEACFNCFKSIYDLSSMIHCLFFISQVVLLVH